MKILAGGWAVAKRVPVFFSENFSSFHEGKSDPNLMNSITKQLNVTMVIEKMWKLVKCSRQESKYSLDKC